MLIPGSKFVGHPVLSLHLGGMVAKISTPIIDPDKMKIVAFWLEGPNVGREYGEILETDDIREISDLGLIIDSADAFMREDEIVRLEKIIEIGFSVTGKKVITKRGTKLGKTIDYTVSDDDYLIQQIIVQRPFMKSFLDPELTISRKEIISVDNEKIIVRDEENKIRERATREDFTPDFVNPFRQQPLAQADNQNPDELDTE